MNKSRFTLYPDNVFKEIWDWIAVILIVFEIIAVPIYVVFESYTIIYVKTSLALTEIFFIVDMSKL